MVIKKTSFQFGFFLTLILVCPEVFYSLLHKIFGGLGIFDIFALFEDDKLVGELHVKYDNEDKNFAEKGNRAYLFAFRVHKDYQGKGLGSYLLETVIDELTNNGYHELTVGVEDDNIRARYMYEKYGFIHPIARIKETYQGYSYEYDLLLRKDN